jgi:Cu/Ag efflux protein CusF
MTKLLATLSAAVLMLSMSTAAFAEETEGMLKSIDSAKHTVTLEDGTVFQMPANVDPATLKVGDAVRITYEIQGDKKIVSEIVK